jgi:hypothetical protein
MLSRVFSIVFAIGMHMALNKLFSGFLLVPGATEELRLLNSTLDLDHGA